MRRNLTSETATEVEKAKSNLGLLTWGSAYVFLFAYRCVYSVLGELVVIRMTSIADTSSYQRGEFLAAITKMRRGLFDACLSG